MKIALFGDIHGFGPPRDTLTIDFVRQVVDRVEADVILQVGDLCFYRSFSRPVYWIYGNNDSPKLVETIERGGVGVENLRHIKTGEILDFSSGEERITVSGLNGAYDPLYYDYSRSQIMGDGIGGYFVKADVADCLKLRDIDIILVHGCPAGLGFGREPDYGVPAIRRLLEEIRPRYMFCGHAHFFRHVEHEGTQVYSLAPSSQEYYILDTASRRLTRSNVLP